MQLFRSSVSVLTVAAFAMAMAASPSEARGFRYGGGGGGGAALGAGLALGILGAAIAAQHAQGGYYARPRYYVPRRRYAHRAPPPPPASAEPTRVATNTPTVLRVFFNCYAPRGPEATSARAEHGFLKERWSSRMVCGRRDFPVKEFEYVSPKDYTGVDHVAYFDGGRPVKGETLDVGDYSKPFEPASEYEAFGTDELSILNSTGCEPAKMEAKADKGFASIRVEEIADRSCPRGTKFKSILVYRAPNDFTGSDTVRLFSAMMAPTDLNINVQPKAVANEPEVPDTPDTSAKTPAPTTTSPAALLGTPAPTQTPAAALSANVTNKPASTDPTASPAPEKASSSTDDKSKDADADALAKELSK